MYLIRIIFTSLGSITALFILTKIMGNRQMSQLSMFDYVNGITIGSIAAEFATALESDFMVPLTAMIVYSAVCVIISMINTKSIRLRRILGGRTLILLEDGKIYESNLKKAHLDMSEFLMQCRNNGYFNIADLQTAVLEPNGKISFLPLANRRPVNPDDMGISPTEEKPVINVIMDGKIMEGNLKFTGNNETWLEKQLHLQGISKVSDVFLGTCDSQNNLSVYVKLTKPVQRDLFQ